MKKLVAVILIVVIALAAFWFVRRPALKLPFADIFPAGAVGYVGVHEGAAQVRDLTESNFWKKLNGIEAVKGFFNETGSRLEGKGLATSIGTLATLFGEDAAAAVYDSKSKFGRAAIGAVKTDEKSEAVLTFIRAACGGKAAGSYRERELYSFRIPAPLGLEGAYARGGGVGIVAVAKSNPMDLMKAAIDLSAGKGGSALATDKKFMALMGEPLREAGTLIGCACFDAKTLEKDLQGFKAAIVKRMEEKNPESAAKVANAWGGQFPWLSWSGYLYRKQGLAGKLRMRLDWAQMTAEQRALFDDGVGKLELLKFVPRGTILVSDSRLGNVSAVWKWYKTQTWPTRELNFLALCEKRLGIDFERDVLPWLGEEVCLQLSDVSTGGLLPIPQVQLVMSVKDRKQAGKKLASIMEHVAQPSASRTPPAWAFLSPEIRDEEYKGEKIKTLAWPIPGLSPSFTFKDRCLIVGLDRSSVQMVVDVAGGSGDALVSDANFAEMRKILPDELHQFSYVDCERAFGAAQGLLRWFLSVKEITSASDDPEKAEKLAELEAALPQIFDALKAFRALMAASLVRDGAIDQYFVLRMRDI